MEGCRDRREAARGVTRPVCGIILSSRGVAQPGGALALGARSRWFESSRPDHPTSDPSWYRGDSPSRPSRQTGVSGDPRPYSRAVMPGGSLASGTPTATRARTSAARPCPLEGWGSKQGSQAAAVRIDATRRSARPRGSESDRPRCGLRPRYEQLEAESKPVLVDKAPAVLEVVSGRAALAVELPRQPCRCSSSSGDALRQEALSAQECAPLNGPSRRCSGARAEGQRRR